MRVLAAMMNLTLALVASSGCSTTPEKMGLSYSGEMRVEQVRLLVDETWTDAAGKRHVKQEIFNEIFEMIEQAEQFVLLDFFLVNQFFYEPGPGLRDLSQEIVDRLLAKRSADPAVRIIFITDPINTVYGSVASPHFMALKDAGVQVVWTDVDRLRDSNPLVSKPWRVLIRPWGTGPGAAVKNPMGAGRISVRSMLKLLNFKANHRKVVVTDKSLLVTSANPHSASSAHWNVALRVDGAGQAIACESESAILRISGAETFSPPAEAIATVCEDAAEDAPVRGYPFQLLTERRIKDQVLELLARAEAGARIDLTMFYLSEKDVMRACIAAKKRGCKIRVILDPAREAFGRTKNGIPNRQSAFRLVKAGIPLRWADTHGEQCHVKMLYVEHDDRTATLLLGSCNFTRRNLDDFNAECNVAVRQPVDHANMLRARELFDRWWKNTATQFFTTDYASYADPSLRRRLRAWLMETTGMSAF